MKNIQKKSGMTILITVIVITAVAALAAVTYTLMSLDEAQSGFYHNQAYETFTATDGCIEEALTKLNSNHSYAGEVFTIGDVSCTIGVTGVGTSRTITATSTNAGDFTRAIQVTVDWSSAFQITNWQELTD